MGGTADLVWNSGLLAKVGVNWEPRVAPGDGEVVLPVQCTSRLMDHQRLGWCFLHVLHHTAHLSTSVTLATGASSRASVTPAGPPPMTTTLGGAMAGSHPVRPAAEAAPRALHGTRARWRRRATLPPPAPSSLDSRPGRQPGAGMRGRPGHASRCAPRPGRGRHGPPGRAGALGVVRPSVILPAAARVDIYIAKCCKYMLHCCIGALFTQQGGVACRGSAVW